MIQITPDRSLLLWHTARSYLSERTNIEKVDELASDKTNPKLTKMSDIYCRLLDSLRNRQGMPRSISNISNLKEVLKGFSPLEVQETYGLDWQKLFTAIQTEVRPTSRMDINSPQNYWVVFTKGALDSAAFLSQFKDGNEFVNSVGLFAENEALVAGMPMVMTLEITGLGFALACDFLKESGWSQYAKPDTHTKKILKGCGFADGTDYGTFKAIVTISKHVDQTPYNVDKVLWLIGSGKLYTINETFDTDRDEFIRRYNQLSTENHNV